MSIKPYLKKCLIVTYCYFKKNIQTQITYALPGVIIAVNVEDRQDVNIHLVQQAGHLRVASIGGHSLRIGTQEVSFQKADNLGSISEMLLLSGTVELYLVDEPLAESSRDPLSGMDTTVQEDGGLGGASLLANL